MVNDEAAGEEEKRWEEVEKTVERERENSYPKETGRSTSIDVRKNGQPQGGRGKKVLVHLPSQSEKLRNECPRTDTNADKHYKRRQHKGKRHPRKNTEYTTHVTESKDKDTTKISTQEAM